MYNEIGDIMKKIITIISILVIVVSLTGCGKTKETDALKFREEYISPILNADLNTKIIIGGKLRKLIGNKMLRRNKEDCLSDLTKKTIYSGCKQTNQDIVFNDRLKLPMNNEQEKLYTNILYEYNNAINKKGLALSTLKLLRIFPQ